MVGVLSSYKGSAAAVLMALAMCAAPETLASEPADVNDEVSEDGDGGWLQAGLGLTLGDTLNINASPYRPGFDPVPSFSVGWVWRIADFDMGLSVTHAPGAHASTLDLEGRPTRLGDQVGVLATLRYRYVEASWGGLYVILRPGLGVSMTTETLRGAIALTEAVLPGDVARLGLGFTFQSATGFYTPLSRRLNFSIEAGAMGTIGVLEVGDDALPYERYRLRVQAGLEWRL